MKCRSTIQTIVLGVLLFTMNASAVPLFIDYQGRLADATGTPITAPADVTFTFFDAETGGTALAGFSDMDTVTPTPEGFYATLIGDEPGLPIPAAIFAGDNVFLNVNVNGENLLPRKRLTTVVYAVRAATVDTITAVNVTQFFTQWQALPDGDGDGHAKISSGGDDCDDLDPTIYPGAPELCDRKDNDCDGAVDEGCTTLYFDNDVDGVGVCDSFIYASQPEGKFTASECGDCDDNEPATHPGATELCDGVDNDCDTQIDDGAGAQCPSGICEGGECLAGIDDDEDGYYSIESGGNDCDDSSPNIHPGAQELCNGIDDNCNGDTDEGAGQPDCIVFYFDGDGDGYGTFDSQCQCHPSGEYSAMQSGDCNDSDPEMNPDAPEICGNMKDDNCNGVTDESPCI